MTYKGSQVVWSGLSSPNLCCRDIRHQPDQQTSVATVPASAAFFPFLFALFLSVSHCLSLSHSAFLSLEEKKIQPKLSDHG